MNIQYNALWTDQGTTADFDFKIFVENRIGYRSGVKKDQLFTNELTSGALKRTVDAWENIEITSKLYLNGATEKQISRLIVFLESAKYVGDYDSDLCYKVYRVKIKSEDEDLFDSQSLEVTWEVESVKYEKSLQKYTVDNLPEIENDGTHIAYPIITVTGVASTQTTIRINEQEFYLWKVDDKVTIDCREHLQNCYDKLGLPKNQLMRGNFPHLDVGTNKITVSNGLRYSLEYMKRWR